MTITRDPAFEMIAIDDLIVDHRYQRPLDTVRAERYATNWDDGLCGALLVSRRNGKSAVFDGQHRLAALRIIDRTEAPCVVYENLTPADEAGLFHLLQSERKTVTWVERHHAKLVAEDPNAVAIEAIVVASGFRIAAGDSHGCINAAGAVYKAFDLYGARVLADSLSVLRETWGLDDRYARTSPAILWMGMFLRAYGDKVRPADVVERLRTREAVDVYRKAHGRGVYDGSALPARWAMEIVETWNLKRRERRLSASELHPKVKV